MKASRVLARGIPTSLPSMVPEPSSASSMVEVSRVPSEDCLLFIAIRIFPILPQLKYSYAIKQHTKPGSRRLFQITG